MNKILFTLKNKRICLDTFLKEINTSEDESGYFSEGSNRLRGSVWILLGRKQTRQSISRDTFLKAAKNKSISLDTFLKETNSPEIQSGYFSEGRKNQRISLDTFLKEANTSEDQSAFFSEGSNHLRGSVLILF